MADAFEDEVEETVTIGEYIQDLEAQEKDLEAQELEADMVLGGDEGKECTYSNGYMKRQAIFSCLTCVPSGDAGVCTACVLSCHDGHEVVELWTKRKFRCDCGNSKFGDFCCKLFTQKDSENLENSYNQNFRGSYCTCGRPYPDPDASEQVEMIQCCICEDWFHENHLGLDPSEEIPRDEDGEPLYDEFICKDCANKCSFLQFYPTSICLSSIQNKATNAHKEECVYVSGTDEHASPGKIKDDICASKVLSSFPTLLAESSTVSRFSNALHVETSAMNMPLENDDVGLSNEVPSVKCIIGMDLNATSVTAGEKKPVFLSKNWRDLLCRCDTCADLYAEKGISYLTDKEDTIEEYEKIAKQKREEMLQQREGAELNFLNNLNHVQKIEIMHGINDMTNELHSFLESFDSSKPVTSADVRGVFENLAKKRQRLQ